MCTNNVFRHLVFAVKHLVAYYLVLIIAQNWFKAHFSVQKLNNCTFQVILQNLDNYRYLQFTDC